MEDLRWLGLSWEEPVRRQSEHMGDYSAALGRLGDMGVIYRCFRTRADLLAEIGRAPHGPLDTAKAPTPGPLPPAVEAARLAAGEAFAWRLSIAAGLRKLCGTELDFLEEGEGPGGERGLIRASPAIDGDIVVARKDLGVSYHLAVVVDDAHQGVTHVVRGQDLFAATHVQRLLQALLGLPAPTYRHHPLILRPDGRRFAKRDTAETLQDLRRRGVAPGALRADLGFDP